MQRSIAVLIGCILAVMSISQLWLDKTRFISIHCLIRNMIIGIGLYFCVTGKLSWLALVAIVIGTEAIIDVAHQLGYSLDPYLNKVLNFYRWSDTLWSSTRMQQYNNYTEGDNNCDANLAIQESQVKKFAWMAAEGRVRPGSRVLEIGCGNGEFLAYVKTMGGRPVGLTPSPDQITLLAKRGLEALPINIWDVDKHPELHQAFDVVVMNGSTEHFLNIQNGMTEAQQDTEFAKMFDMVRYCIDPHSDSKRCVITAIHLNRPFSLYEYMQVYLLERTYGGMYPRKTDTYIRAAQPHFSIVTNQDRTMDYYIWARKIWYNVYAGLTDIGAAGRTLVDVPVFALNDPYYVHKVLHCIFSTWSWQFDVPNNPLLAYDQTPPTIHLWQTYKLN